MSENKSHSNIDIVTGDPKVAIRKLSWPMMISMLLIMAYNLADSIWVAGLGPDALSALGFITPLFLIMVGLGNGLGAGANSLIARAIGAKDKKLADNAALHSILITIIISIILPIILLFLLEDMLILMGAGNTTPLALAYGNIVFLGMFPFLFSSVAASILRSEGDVKRAMYAMVITAVFNVILDPIFIYILNLGVEGAAYATLLSSILSCLVMVYWLFIKKDTYISLLPKNFNYSTFILRDIISVALPASIEQLILSFISVLLNAILAMVASTVAVGVFIAGWRLIMMGAIPFMGIGTAVVTVAGASYGAQDWDKLKLTFNYSTRLGLVIGVVLTALFWIFAPQLALLFGYSAESAQLTPQIANLLRVMAFFFLCLPLGVNASSVFQGVGKGLYSLMCTILREVVFILMTVYILAFVFSFGEQGVWWGFISGAFIGSLVGYLWGKLFISKLEQKGH